MTVLKFIAPFEMFFTSDLVYNFILVFFPFVIVAFALYLLKEVFSR